MFLDVPLQKLPATAFYAAEDACYQDIGCFNFQDEYSHSVAPPQSPEEIQTEFHLYSRKNQDHLVLDYLNKTTLDLDDHFNKTKGLIVIAHGFGESGHSRWVINMTKTFLEMDDMNVIVVHWARGSAQPLYITASANTALVGRQTSRLLELLVQRYPDTILPSRIHLVGFSLGAHVVGFCGRSFTKNTGQKIGRITGKY